MYEKIYLSTGELAKMFDVTKQTIIYYDNVGLLCPAKRGEKDYRYYTLEQADELDSILTFRNLGVPIETLKEYLSIRNADGCIDMLQKQKEQVEKEIKKLERIRRKIEGRNKLLQQVSNVKTFERIEFSKEKETRYMLEPCLGEYDKAFLESFIAICTKAKALHIDFENPVCSIICKDSLISGNYKNTSYFGIKVPEDFNMEIPQSFIKPFGIYASTYHKGSYDRLPLSYERLIKGIEKNDYEICGNAYEMDLLSTLTNTDSNEYLKHISIQVKKIDY